MTEFYLEPSDLKTKKWMVSFLTDSGRLKTIHFGQAGASDFTQHKNKVRRDKYEARHKANEDWTDPTSGAGFWSYWLLWHPETSSFKEAIKKTNKKFNIKIHLIE